jgi:hypothetical protein
MLEGPLAWSLLSAVFTGGIAFGGFKVALNGTKERLDHLEEQEDAAVEHRVEVGERLSSLETKIDMIYDKVK